ncbi:molybdenum formylmethanofuran dehydrogenase subunit fmde related protein [Desulfosarcina widdelii]|uniref:Molybdenum formylmethanofuran dehydrogenase subunit fmde related protein n=1 Tax=Desulfosarcina widdelii TaxID=947919 RepID=A0A5K7ZBU3_9BACT|nr:FmdE family protein [Desulfosarcina widdelii]BBO78568.1 molybdenum formylmethanofuran dehydrogenase subunit fmde related protein [Desulfosarcina widdelii]
MDTAEIDKLKQNPRKNFIQAVREKDTLRCLVKAAELHGHFCPGIALGVMASVYGLWELGVQSIYFDGIMEDLVAIVEVNACFADGVQAVSGCTLGNNALVYRDLGRLAVTFARRGKETGVRVRVGHDFVSLVAQAAPSFYSLLEKVIKNREGSNEDMDAFREQAKTAAFSLVQESFEKLLVAEPVKPMLPAMAPVKPSSVCPACGEEIMGTKIVREGQDQGLCFTCGHHPYFEVEGRGIVKIDNNCTPTRERAVVE